MASSSSLGGASRGSSRASTKRRKNKVKHVSKDATDESLHVPILQIGDEAPNFTCNSTVGMFGLHDIIDGSFSVVVTFAGNTAPVACTELGMLSKLKEEFKVSVVWFGEPRYAWREVWGVVINPMLTCTHTYVCARSLPPGARCEVNNSIHRQH